MRYHERRMGAFYVTIGVGDAAGKRFEDVRTLTEYRSGLVVAACGHPRASGSQAQSEATSADRR